jgi:hypothetical protein
MVEASLKELKSWWGDVQALLELHSDSNWRSLKEDELEQLQESGNSSDDWGKVLVRGDFRSAGFKGNIFRGACFLSSPGEEGIVGVRLSGVTLDQGVTIRDSREISNMVIGRSCRIVGCGSLAGGAEASWSPFLNVEMGSEMGDRGVCLHPFVRLEEISEWVKEGRSGRSSEAIKERSGLPEIVTQSVLMPDCDLEGLIRADGVCLGPATRVRDASFLKNVVSLSSLGEEVHLGSGVILRDVQLLWGAGVEDQAQLQAVRVGEQSHLGLKVTAVQSCIGPDNHIDRGEVAASLLGPMVGLHHQCLLIGAIWPGGRGNVGYGANVGSNHTGKKPDQEFLPGEGCFLGLDITIKYPSNFEGSPYSLLATGVKALPQKMEMPFSLLLPGDSSLSEGERGRNEIRPGWVYLHNSYLLHRNEMKFMHRRRSRRTPWDSRPLRVDWIPYVHGALKNLEKLSGKEIYTERDCPALGANYLKETGLEEGKAAYRQLLLHLIRIALLDGKEVEEKILNESKEHGLEETVEALKAGLKEDLGKQLDSAKEALQRDFSRGRAIMPDYDHGHAEGEKDPVLLDLKSRIEAL